MLFMPHHVSLYHPQTTMKYHLNHHNNTMKFLSKRPFVSHALSQAVHRCDFVFAFLRLFGLRTRKNTKSGEGYSQYFC